MKFLLILLDVFLEFSFREIFFVRNLHCNPVTTGFAWPCLGVVSEIGDSRIHQLI